MWLHFGSLINIQFIAPIDSNKCTNIQCIWQDFGCKFFKNVLVSALIFSAFFQILTVVLKSSLVHLVIETNALIFSVSSQILAVLLGSSLSHLKIGTNSLYGVTSSSKNFWYVWEYALIFSACGYILALLLILSLLHLVIQTHALILS